MSEPIYTRNGDGGETSLADGTRVSKAAARVEAYGAIDEANSVVGLARSAIRESSDGETDLDRILGFVQHRLMSCAGALATPTPASPRGVPAISAADITHLERSVDRLSERAGNLDHFVLPAGCELAARLHVARTVVRRAERRLAALAATDDFEPLVMQFVNRLSDLLFAAARYANAEDGCGDEEWDPGIRA